MDNLENDASMPGGGGRGLPEQVISIEDDDHDHGDDHQYFR